MTLVSFQGSAGVVLMNEMCRQEVSSGGVCHMVFRSTLVFAHEKKLQMFKTVLKISSSLTEMCQ